MYRLALSAWVVALSCFAQEGARGMALFAFPARPELRWRLYTEAPAAGLDPLLSRDARLQTLVAMGLAWSQLTRVRLQNLVERTGSTEVGLRWLLLDGEGKVQARGSESLQDGRPVEDALRAAFGRLPLDQLDDLLREHKDHGEARLARLEWLLALGSPVGGSAARFRVAADSRAIRTAAVDALADLRKVPDWCAQVPLGNPGFGQRLLALLDADGLRGLIREVTDALAGNPANPLLQQNLALLHRRLGAMDLDAARAAWEEIEPLPGQPWPPLPLVSAHLDRLLSLSLAADAKHWAGAWSRGADPLWIDPASWKDLLLREGTLATYACIAETLMEGTQAAVLESLDRIRAMAGSSCAALVRFYLSRIRLPDDPDFRRKVEELAARPGLPDTPMPTPLPPWRLALADPALLPMLRAAFQEDRELLLWLPSEWQVAPALQQAHPLEAWLGDELRFAPEALPGRGALADALARDRPGRLRTASDQVDRAPEQPGRRRFRIPLLLARMPARALEHLLAEDLRRAGAAVRLDGFPPDPNLWWAEAQRAVPDLEAHLRRWPLDGERWEALAFWCGFLPRHEGPAALADLQPSWQARLSFRLALPTTAHGRVGEQLARRRAWSQALAWFLPAWDDLQRLRREDFRRWPWLTGTADATFAHLDRAYAALGQEGLRRSLRLARAGLPIPDPGVP